MNEATLKNRSCLVERERQREIEKIETKEKRIFGVAESFVVELVGGENILQGSYLVK